LAREPDVASGQPDGAALPRVLYHVSSRVEWEASRRSSGSARATSRMEEDVILVGPDAYVELANRVYGGRRDIVLLFIDSHRLTDVLRRSTVDDVPVLAYPSPFPVSAVFEVADLPTDHSSRFVAHHETAALVAHGDDTVADARARAVRAVEGWDRRWWIAGGWALDLHLGAMTRPHADLEVSILRSDQASLYSHLTGWDLRAVAPGARLIPWDGTPLEQPYHQIWARRGHGPADTIEEFVSDPTMLDFLIEDHVAEQWCFRRDHRVTLATRDIGETRDGVSYIRPEIALLYKAKEPRFKDERDFQHVAPSLASGAREWLGSAICVAHPGHAWLSALAFIDSRRTS
jgi:uncharacterized protein (DUF952 family)